MGGRNLEPVSEPSVVLLSIGEFSAVCQLSVKMLRHYHAIGLLEPAMVDDRTGYRYYRFSQSADALVVKELRDLDVPLAEIAALLRADEVTSHELLTAHRSRLRRQLAEAERRLAHVERILRREPTMGYEITERTFPAQRVASMRVSGPNTPESNRRHLMDGFATVLNAIVSAGGSEADVTGPPVAVVHYGDEDRFEQELCLPVDRITTTGEVTIRELESVTAAVARHNGDLPNVREVMEWANARGHRVGTPFRVVLIAAPPYFGDGEEMVSDIVVPYLELS